MSIPQRNSVLKGLSIASLGVYASVCKFFVVVAPDAKHSATKKKCDADTYQRRGWCRLEQWARIAVGGFTQMYIWLGSELEPLENRPKWYTDSIHVFQGEFTDTNDKAALVDTVCGVWAHALRSKTKDSEMLVELVRKNRANIFPTEYFSDLVDILEKEIDALEFEDLIVKNDSLPPELMMLPANTNAQSKTVKKGLSLREVVSGVVAAHEYDAGKGSKELGPLTPLVV